MDEPPSNLDAKLRVQMRAEVQRIQRGLVSTIYVTHDEVEAMMAATRVAVLRGRKAAGGGGLAQHLDGNPDNIFVAAFIGSPSP